MASKLIAYLKILRPVNFLITFASVFSAVLLSDRENFLRLESFIVALSASLIGSAGMVINDFFDIEIDKINRPERPVASGIISKKEAFIYFILLNFIGLVLAAFLNILTLFIAGLSVVIIFFYSYKLKSTIIWGNLTVSFMTALAFFYGASLNSNFRLILIPAVFAFLTNFVRELLKDAEDEAGDRSFNVKTAAIYYGKKFSVLLSVLILIIIIVCSILIFIFNIYSLYYLLIILFLVDLPFVILIKMLIRQSDISRIHLVQTVIKYLMPVGLISFLVG